MGKQWLSGQGNQNDNHDLGFNPGQFVEHAMSHDAKAGSDGANASVFSQVTSWLDGRKQQGHINDQGDHNEWLGAFRKVQSGQNATSQEIGQASAVDALKQYFGNNEHKEPGGFNALLGKAVSFAGSKAPADGKQDAMNHAGETIMKMAMKHKMKSMFSGYNEGVSELMDLYQ